MTSENMGLTSEKKASTSEKYRFKSEILGNKILPNPSIPGKSPIHNGLAI
ncbi:hypothetical protein [Paenisporosarcina sp. OV554]|nr:hypothetical protein [Paenisporosarcina sp. OV554]